MVAENHPRPLAIPTLADLWAQYEARVLPAETPAALRKELRRAFYQGINGALGALVIVGSQRPGAYPAHVQRMLDELATFAANVKAGKA